VLKGSKESITLKLDSGADKKLYLKIRQKDSGQWRF